MESTNNEKRQMAYIRMTKPQPPKTQYEKKMEARHFQKAAPGVLKSREFIEMVQEAARVLDVDTSLVFNMGALKVLREGVEALLIGGFSDGQNDAELAKRCTVKPGDMWIGRNDLKHR